MLVPGRVDVVSLDDIYGAVVEQFCGMDDDLAKEVVAVLVENNNFDYILDKVCFDRLLLDLNKISKGVL